jgi:hypothetical protein
MKCISMGFKIIRFENGFLNIRVLENPDFWFYDSLRDSLGSVRRKRVPQVRAREDNPYGYPGSLVLVKMCLMSNLTLYLA